MEPTEVAKQLDAEFRSSCARLNSDEPWFGRFDLRVDGKPRPYKVGAKRVPDERIVDWRHPLARAYYDADPGDEFELDQRGFAGVRGVVDSLATLTSQARTVRRVELRTAQGKFELFAGELGFQSQLERARPPTKADGLPDVLSLLTPEQYRLITSDRYSPVIIQGRAGSGKTTVALYRVSWLTFADEEATVPPIDPAKVLVVMFNKALSGFVRGGLNALHLQGVQLDTFHAWALHEIRRSYRGAIEIDSAKRPDREIAGALKKQLGMIAALDAFVSRQTAALETWLEDKLRPYDAAPWLKRFRSSTAPVVRRVVQLRSQALAERDLARGAQLERLTQVHLIFETAVRRMTQYKEELLKFLTDTAALSAHFPNASQRDLQALATFQRSLQGEGGTERRPGPNVAFEDLALLLRLIQLKNGGYPDKDRDEEIRLYEHLVIDEAQDFGAVELTALLASVRSQTGVTIVGDLNQKILPDVDFIGWDELARKLGVSGAQVTRLEVVHRSTGAIMRVADSVLGDPASGPITGAAPTLTLAAALDAMIDEAAAIAKAARELDRSAHVCVVCRSKTDAERVHVALATALSDLGTPVRLGHSKQFEFTPGITVTNAQQVKGLEFDVVIVFDPSPERYPVTKDARRALYMVLTRAKERLHFVGHGEVSPLLQPALEHGWLEVRRKPSIPPVTFTEEDDDPF
jgi:DNA helicase II / ATP-dependent DNA helicase PcrA